MAKKAGRTSRSTVKTKSVRVHYHAYYRAGNGSIVRPKTGSVFVAPRIAEQVADSVTARLSAIDQLGKGPDKRAEAGVGPLPEKAFDRKSIYE